MERTIWIVHSCDCPIAAFSSIEGAKEYVKRRGRLEERDSGEFVIWSTDLGSMQEYVSGTIVKCSLYD